MRACAAASSHDLLQAGAFAYLFTLYLADIVGQVAGPTGWRGERDLTVAAPARRPRLIFSMLISVPR
jgi:hypothetical protein